LTGKNLVDRAGVPLGKERGELVGRVERDRDSDQGLNSDVIARSIRRTVSRETPARLASAPWVSSATVRRSFMRLPSARKIAPDDCMKGAILTVIFAVSIAYFRQYWNASQDWVGGRREGRDKIVTYT